MFRIIMENDDGTRFVNPSCKGVKIPKGKKVSVNPDGTIELPIGAIVEAYGDNLLFINGGTFEPYSKKMWTFQMVVKL